MSPTEHTNAIISDAEAKYSACEVRTAINKKKKNNFVAFALGYSCTPMLDKVIERCVLVRIVANNSGLFFPRLTQRKTRVVILVVLQDTVDN